MSESWYYVLEGERQGPIEHLELRELIGNGVLGQEDYVWKKGFDNWKKIYELDELKNQEESLPGVIQKDEVMSFNLASYDKDSKSIYIKVGADRGANEVEYGPFTIEIIKKLYDENRINGKTFVFAKGLKNWTVLADLNGFEQVFNQLPPIIEEKDKRAFKRKPLIARMFIQNKNQVYEGICRDLSIGGMQVLVDNFPGQIGEKIAINVHPENEDHHFVASGEIVRMLEGGQGFSFRFIDLEKNAINSINSYIG